jgi:arsenate reductase (glutaredoxin)
LAVAEAEGADAEVVLYMKTPPDRAALEHLVSILEDPVEDLVRKDSQFKKLELNPDDYVGNAAAVVDLLAERKALMQRPVIVKGDRAIIGRPKDRVGEFLNS